jgi:hypothetical protein
MSVSDFPKALTNVRCHRGVVRVIRYMGRERTTPYTNTLNQLKRTSNLIPYR